MLVTEPEEQERWSKCRECPFRVPGPEFIGDQCGACGCLLDAKVMLTMEECPKKKWLRIWRKAP